MLTKKGEMMVAAHRGDSFNHFENTMGAFRAAIESGADMIETDVHLTRDGHLVLMHDENIYKTAGVPGKIGEMSFKELRSLNVGGAYEPERIPTLDEFMELISKTDTLLNLEIKEMYTEGNEERCERCIDMSVETVLRYNYADKMVINSFDAHVLEYVSEKYPGVFRLHGFYPYTIMKNVTRNPDDYLYCACVFDEKKDNFDYLLTRGIEPWVGEKDTQISRLKASFEMGARVVTTNYPADAISKLQAIGARIEKGSFKV